jgi:hypothetical protein
VSRFRTLFLAMFWSLGLPAFASGGGEGWETIDNKSGIEVQRKTMPESPLFAFRGEGVVSVPIALLVTVLLDDEIAVEWVDLMTEHAMVRDQSPTEKVIYEAYGLPWPISDRDYVMMQTTRYDDTNLVFTLDFESMVDPAKPVREDHVRAMAYRTFWRLKKIDDVSTNVEVEVFTDPKGSLPAWLINLIQKDWPWKTIEGLVGRAIKGDIEAEAHTAAW